MLAVTLALVAPICSYGQNQTSDQKNSVNVFLPDGQNLQWMNFWVAYGASFFEDEAVSVKIVLPDEAVEENASGALRVLFDGSADVVVMPRPIFLMAVSRSRPVLAFANLLRHDPINLVVQREIVEDRGLSLSMPLQERLNRIRGLKIGVAPGPPTRLSVLLASAGLDMDSEVEIVIVPGDMQNEFFAQRQVDAIYAHTPFLEKALAQGGVMVVNQSAGEVAELAHRQIHMLVTTQKFAAENSDAIIRLTRAIYRAQLLIHADKNASVEAIRRSGVRLQAPEDLATLVDIYEPAIPATPEVSADGALRELALFPRRRQRPDLSNVDMTTYVDNRFAESAIQTREN
jgi:ABC-type nitrate/sulfonate/bicarbonate transport system substrate-binding protein